MEFLGIGYQEVLLVLVLALIVVGPARMPLVAYQIGKAVREMQKYARAVRDEFSEEWDYLDSQAKEIRGEVDSASRDMKDLQRSLRSETESLDRELKSATGDVKAATEDAQKAAALPAGSASANGNGKNPATKPAATGKTLSSTNVNVAGRKPGTFAPSPSAKPSVNGNSAEKLRDALKANTTDKPEAAAEATPTEPAATTGSKPEEKKANKPPLVF